MRGLLTPVLAASAPIVTKMVDRFDTQERTIETAAMTNLRIVMGRQPDDVVRH